VQHSPYYLKAVAAASEKSWGKAGAASAFLPHLSLDATRFFRNQFQTLPFSLGGSSLAFPEVFPYQVVGLNASWTVFDGLRGVNTLRASLLEGEAADLDRDWTLIRVRQEVRLKFIQALGAQKLAVLADQNVDTLKEHLRMVQDLLDNGRATRFDLLRVEVQLDDAKTEQLAAQDRVALTRRQLTLAMGEEQDPRTLIGELPKPQDAPAPALSVEEKPDVKAKFLQADAAQKQAYVAAAHWAPRVSVIGAYERYWNGYDLATAQMDASQTEVSGRDYNLGVAASWELFNGFGSVAKEMEACKRAEEARQTARQAALQATYDRDFWGRRLVLSTQTYQAKLADVDKAAESVRLATLGEQAGTRTTTEVLDAELDSFRASAGVVSAQLDAAEALINLELALGKGDPQ
jgi:outer membrane protein TolC